MAKEFICLCPTRGKQSQVMGERLSIRGRKGREVASCRLWTGRVCLSTYKGYCDMVEFPKISGEYNLQVVSRGEMRKLKKSWTK